VAELIVVICVTEEFFYSIKRGGMLTTVTNFHINQFCSPEARKTAKKVRKKIF